MDVVSSFAKALDACSGDDPDLLPERLAHAAAAALPVDGVGLSVHGSPDLRTPLAASSEFAAAVERLQFTIGRGPCLLAATSGMPVFATEDLLARRWPEFHDVLVDKTPIRSMLALSLRGRLRGVGAMDLYFTDPDGPTTVDVFEARCVAELVSERLGPAADWSVWTPEETPGWPDTLAARQPRPALDGRGHGHAGVRGAGPGRARAAPRARLQRRPNRRGRRRRPGRAPDPCRTPGRRRRPATAERRW